MFDRFRVLVAVLLLSTGSSIATVAQGRALFVRHGNLVPSSTASNDASSLMRTLLAGPSGSERRAGVTTAIAPGTRLLGIATDGGRVVVDVSASFTTSADAELALEQIVKSLASLGYAQFSVRTPDPAAPKAWLEVGAAPPSTTPILDLPPPPVLPSKVTGVLTGKTIAVSPGHGYYWHSSLGWTTQRGNIGGLTEDIHTNEIAMEWVIPYLENAGARVISCRDRTRNTNEHIVDNDGGPGYVETGSWGLGGGAGFNSATYRFATTAAAETARATFTTTVAAAGAYPVWIGYKAGTNRATDARVLVEHAGGTSEVKIDQTADDLRLRYLGTFWFDPATPARVHVSNQSSQVGRVVIADHVRIGGGLGSIARGGTSNRPRWQEASRYWTQFAGAPSSVWNSVSSGEDNSDDVTARPRYAEWRGANAFVSIHTNAGGGTGTSSFIHNTSPSAGSSALQNAVHTQLISDIRSLYDPAWTDRGKKTANFGEVRVLSTMPGVLLELAFHDDPNKKDHVFLHDPNFRQVCGRAIARGVIRYFNQTAPFPPEPPTRVRVTQDGNGGLRVSWDAAAAASGYVVEESTDGLSFSGVGMTVTGTTWTTTPLPHGALRGYRVRATNASGQSLPTEVVVGRTGPTGRADVLLVQGFDRLEKNVKEPDNRRNYLARFLDAIGRIADYSVAIDSASNEALATNRVPIQNYRAVVFALGEESTADETFSLTEQNLVRAYLQIGGRVFVSGAEIAWDLDQQGSATDRAFYRTWLAASYVNDDANVYRAGPAAGSAFAGLPDLTFDNGTAGTYDVNYPDSLAPSGTGAKNSLLYRGTSFVAATEQVNGNARVLNWGFPFETITDRALAGRYMDRAIDFLLQPRALDVVRTATPGGTVPITIERPAHASAQYVLAASFSTQPGIPVGGGRTVPLVLDPLFATSFGSSAGVFQGFVGTLDGSGRANAQVNLPNLPIQGLRFYVSGVVLTGPTIVDVLPWRRVTVQ